MQVMLEFRQEWSRAHCPVPNVNGNETKDASYLHQPFPVAQAMPLCTPAPASGLIQTPQSPPELFMGFDYGVRRIGVCVGTKQLSNPQPCKSVSGTAQQQWTQITACIAQWQPDALVVGVPFHPDGAEHVNTHKARRFMRQLSGRYKLPVFEVDERYSTTQALRDSAGLRGRVDIDAQSACIILDQFFRSLKS